MALSKRPVLLLAIFFCAIALLHTGQDFLHAHLNGYRGYLSESLLFKTYWLLFIPAGALVFRYGPLLRKQGPRYQKWLVGLTGATFFTLVHIAATALLIVLLSNVWFRQPFEVATPLRYFTSEHFYLTLFFYGAGFAFILYKKEKAVLPPTEKPPQEPAASPFFIPVSIHNKVVPVPVKDVLFISADKPYINIHTLSGNYLHTATLKEMEEKLAPSRFVRIHRATIVNTTQVAHYKSRSNGDYDITLTNGAVVRMSRNYYAGFKKVML